MGKQKLLVLMGAGTSLSNRLPGVAEIDREMKGWAAEISGEPATRDYFRDLWESAALYSAAGEFRQRDGWPPNFEQVLGHMLNLAHWEAPPPYGNPLRLAVQPGAELPSDFGEQQLILHQATSLFGRLARLMRERSLAVDFSTSTFAAYRRAIEGLCERFEVGIYTLNYDTLAIEAWPEAFTGFSEAGDFDPRAVHRREDWSFIYHLHGSVHHTLTDPVSRTIRWEADLRVPFFDGDRTPADDQRTDLKIFPRTTLIAGGFKLDQLLVEPFQTFYASLARHVKEAEAILIAGYGFGDVHVNRVLLNRLMRLADRPPVVVITKSWADELSVGERQNQGERQACDLCRTVNCFFDLHASGANGQSQLPGLLEEGRFEEAMSRRAAIWHDGFETVAGQIDRFSARLMLSPQ